jgi:SAM-dependent methyltransferase
MFVQRLNATTGELEWAAPACADGAADDDDDDDVDDAVADAVAGSSYLDMLNDAPRNEAFAAALSCVARGRAVLDIGTGTGLLAALAARAGAARVTACEVFPPMARVARAVAAANAAAHTAAAITVVPKRSDELTVGPNGARAARPVPHTHTPRTRPHAAPVPLFLLACAGDMAARAEVLVFEVLDSELLGEGVLPTLRDARARLLAPGAAVIPARAAVRAALVECEALRRCHHVPACAGGGGGGAAADEGDVAQGGAVCTLAPAHALHLGPFGRDVRGPARKRTRAARADTRQTLAAETLPAAAARARAFAAARADAARGGAALPLRRRGRRAARGRRVGRPSRAHRLRSRYSARRRLLVGGEPRLRSLHSWPPACPHAFASRM